MLMGQRLCKELALVVAAWPAACHDLAGIDRKWPRTDMQVLVAVWEKLA